MSNLFQKKFEDFFQSCSKPIEKVLRAFLDSDTCPNLSCKFTNFSEVNMAKELISNQDVIYKFEFIANDKNNCAYALMPEQLIAKLSDIMTGGSGDIKSRVVLTETEINSIKEIVATSLERITNFFNLQHDVNLIFSLDHSVYLKEMSDYESILSDCNLTFIATADVTLKSPDETFPLKLLLNKKFLLEFMSQLGFDENSSKRNMNDVNIKQLSDIKTVITAELGKTQLPIKCALELTKDSLVELDTTEDDVIKLYANDLLFAYAQVVAVDGHFGVRITKIIPPEERMGNEK